MLYEFKVRHSAGEAARNPTFAFGLESPRTENEVVVREVFRRATNPEDNHGSVAAAQLKPILLLGRWQQTWVLTTLQSQNIWPMT